MKKVSVFIDGYNLYHAVERLKKPHLKWVNLFSLFAIFAPPELDFKIIRVIFFTAPPTHKSKEVQKRYYNYIRVLEHYGVEIVEGKFKEKLISYADDNGKLFTKKTYEEKESDVNIALAILEDAFEKTSDKILVATNDSDISPAIRLALTKNSNLKINVITPPLEQGRKANFDLMDACGDVHRTKKQVFFKTRMISEEHLEKNLLPNDVLIDENTKIIIPDKYRGSRNLHHCQKF